jgi:hypothetical protein
VKLFKRKGKKWKRRRIRGEEKKISGQPREEKGNE